MIKTGGSKLKYASDCVTHTMLRDCVVQFEDDMEASMVKETRLVINIQLPDLKYM